MVYLKNDIGDEGVEHLMLRGGRVTAKFRSELFDAANRAGMSVNEFVLTSAARQLRSDGRDVPGVFFPGDIDQMGF